MANAMKNRQTDPMHEGARASLHDPVRAGRALATSHRQSRARRVHVSELMLPPQSVRTGLALSILGLMLNPLFSPESRAQSIRKSGPESAFLGTPSGEQVWPSMAIGTGGGFLVWEDNTIEGSGRGRGIAAVRVGADLTRSGESFRVNSQTAGNQEKPQTALLTDGRALVTWESRPANGSGSVGIYGRVLAADGGYASDQFRVSPVSISTNLKQKVSWTGIFRNRTQTRTYKFKETISSIREHAGGASIVALPDGGAVVVYHGVRRAYTNTWALVRQTKYNGIRSMTNDYLRPIRLTGDWMQDVYLQRLDGAGQPVGTEVQVNQYDRFNQRDPSVTMLANGHVLVAWVSERPVSGWSGDNFSVGIFAREMTSSGEPVGNEFPVGEDPARASANPVVTVVGTGFGVYWSQHEQVFSSRWNVYGRVFEAAGRPAGPPFVINSYTAGDQYAPRLASSGGSQLVVWTSLGQDGSREGVYGRALVNGLPAGEEFPVHTTATSRQHQPVVAGTGDGRYVAVWSGYVGSTGFDLFSQAFSTEAAQPQQ